MDKNTIAIIGGAGFLGTSLVNRLKRNLKTFKVFDIDDSKKNITYINVEDRES